MSDFLTIIAIPTCNISNRSYKSLQNMSDKETNITQTDYIPYNPDLKNLSAKFYRYDPKFEILNSRG